MFGARILADSIGPVGSRLTTFEVVFPRIVLAEFNTHRMFSRNSASSRAIPVAKMLERVKNEPFLPYYWGKNQKGMSADQELTEQEQRQAELEWLLARDHAITRVNNLMEIGVHKQITNRLLEPFLWHTVIFTATEMDNFYALRADKHAQPEIRRPAEMLIELFESHKPMELKAGEWHLPLVTDYDFFLEPTPEFPSRGWRRDSPEGAVTRGDVSVEEWIAWAKISTARCARTTYLTHEGKRDLIDDLRKHDELLQNGHMSPFEHAAKALEMDEWKQLMHIAISNWIYDHVPVGNFHGWLQYRKTLPKEHNFKLIKGAK